MKYNSKLTTEIITSPNSDIVKNISKLEPLFPEKIQEDKDKIKSNLIDMSNISILLKSGTETVGYLLATPHNKAVHDLEFDDVAMKRDSQRYYLDKIVVLPEYRSNQAFLILVIRLLKEAGAKGIHRISSHILVGTGLNKTIKKMFKTYITEARMTILEMYDNALFEYIEFSYSEKDVQAIS